MFYEEFRFKIFLKIKILINFEDLNFIKILKNIYLWIMADITRHNHLRSLEQLQDKKLIKVITGVRRCGKSTLMLQFQELIRNKNSEAPIISLNMDVPEYRFIAESGWKGVYDFIEKALVKDKKNYVFLDEVQNVAEFEKLLEGLFVHPDVDLYVTGSNAYLLSSELATLLTGRAFEISLLPFSFAEYLEARADAPEPGKAFNDYLYTGGFPDAVNLAAVGANYAYQYLQTVFENIYQNDILKRHQINSVTAYREVVNFLTDSVGSIVSARNIANTLQSGGRKTDNKTVAKYIDTLVESYLFYKASRFDIKGKQHMATQEKYYLVDTGLRGALLGKELDTDYGHLLENVVYLELLRRGNKVWVGKIGTKETDFVTLTSDGYTRYYQVAYSVSDPKTLEREIAPFNLIKDHNEKILLTMDYQTGSRNGIKQINVVDWLLGRE